MSIRKRTILAVVAVGGIAAVGGSAFTASNDVPDSVADRAGLAPVAKAHVHGVVPDKLA